MSDVQFENREITVTVTPAPEFTLFFDRMVGVEELGRPFRYELDLVTTSTAKAKLGSMLGATMSVKVELEAQGQYRYFHGIITRATYLGTRGRLESYRFELRPRLWLLSHKVDSRIFLNKTWLDCVKAILSANGIAVTDRTTGAASLPVQEFVVQYRESCFDFVSRLMEEAGVYYFHDHKAGDHSLILADDSSGHKPLPGNARIKYFDSEGDSRYRRTQDHVFDWVTTATFTAGAFAQRDYNFTTPAANMEGKSTLAPDPAHNMSGLEVYDYPGDHASAAEGRTLAGIRMQEIAAQRVTARGEANVRTLVVGGTFTLEDYSDTSQNIEHLVTSVTYNLSIDESAGTDTTADSFLVVFQAIPATTRFRPRRLTPRPVIQGPQTAKVVGTQGQEIDCDQYGRVKVKFYWDRAANADENSSCWIRVSQPWAGVGWGGITIPRIGQEVIVEFLEGDPDRPIITGRVYNADATVPYALPGQKNVTTIMSRSTPNGSASTFNEIKFDDTKGSELFYQRAEYKLTVDVMHNDRLINIKEGQDTLNVDQGNRTVNVKQGNYVQNVSSGNRTINVDKGNLETNVKQGNDTLNVNQGNHNINVKQGNQTFSISAGKQSVTAGQEITHTVGANSVKIDTSSITLTVGANSIKMDNTSITLTAGANSIKMDPSGVTVSGAPNATLSAAAMAEVSGALVKIN